MAEPPKGPGHDFSTPRTIQPDDKDYRDQVIETGFSEEDDRIYERGMAFLMQEAAAGTPWKTVKARFKLADAELRRIILDDFVKIAVAKRHFQGGESLKEIGKSLKIPTKELAAHKQEMIGEVAEASVKAYRLSQQEQEESEK